MNVLCVAGFLGSGKTTMLLEVARAMAQSGVELAVIENEIGEVGIDGGCVRERGLPVRELFGGCICCTLQAGLVDALREVEAEYAPDWAIIEPTGLAVPRDVITLVRSRLPGIETHRVLVIVDAVRWTMLQEVLAPLITAQLESADVVALNKVDAISDEALEGVEASIRQLTGATPVVRTVASQAIGVRALLEAIV